MAIRPILTYPDERLRTVAKPVIEFDDALRTLVDDMFETMYDDEGIGLAATQVNVHQQVITIDLQESPYGPMCLINPEIVARSGEVVSPEGCLSVPGARIEVQRSESIELNYLDIEGKAQQLKTDDYLAICIQHEMDHLKGVLLVDYLSKLKQERLRTKIEKMKKRSQE